MSLRKQLLNLLFPPRCPFCNQPLHDAETGPCPDCQQAPFWTQGAQGVARGQNFVRCACAGWYRGGLRDSLRRFKFSGQKGYAATYGPILAQAVRPTSPAATMCSPGCPSPPPGERAGALTSPAAGPGHCPGLGHRAVSCWPRRGTMPPVLLTQGSQRRFNVAGVYTVPSRRRWQTRVLVIDDILTTAPPWRRPPAPFGPQAAQVVAAVLARTPGKQDIAP
ncbi:MAG: ComF family protein [Evtepia sp.]